MRRALIALTALFAIAAPAVPQATGPIQAKPRPSTAPPSVRPPPPRIGERPIERDRNPVAYTPPSDPILVKAIEANKAFDERLPNFICTQHITRSTSRNLGKKWKEDDVVEAEVAIVDSHEQYRDIKIDGRATGAKDLSQIGGAWSMGEYGSVLWNIFIPPSRTHFTRLEDDTIGDRETAVYDYRIQQENSRWTLHANGQEYAPGHFGKVWIDLDSGRALRIEMEATYLPYEFPLNTAKGTIDFSDVDIDGQSYLLPTLAENEICVRDSARCQKLRIEFRDYRKFTADSTLFTTESDIQFGQQVPEQPETGQPQPQQPQQEAPAPGSEPKR
jgi:hypothetical protein